MPETKDYAKYRNQLGKTFYRWYIYRLDEDDNVLLASGEEPTNAMGFNGSEFARQAAAKKIFEHLDADQIAIYRGEYRTETIDDDELGLVYDVDWVEDEHWTEYGYLKGHRGGRAIVEWETG